MDELLETRLPLAGMVAFADLYRVSVDELRKLGPEAIVAVKGQEPPIRLWDAGALAWVGDGLEGMGIRCYADDDDDARSALRKISENCWQDGACIELTPAELEALNDPKRIVRL